MDQNPINSLFYDTFPSEQSSRANNPIGEGYFEDLQQFVGFYFDMSDEEALKIFEKDFGNGGIFFYTPEEKDWIRRSNFAGKTSEPSKFAQMATYLFEITYNIALDRLLNVSESPGFEACGLLFEKRAPGAGPLAT